MAWRSKSPFPNFGGSGGDDEPFAELKVPSISSWQLSFTIASVCFSVLLTQCRQVNSILWPQFSQDGKKNGKLGVCVPIDTISTELVCTPSATVVS